LCYNEQKKIEFLATFAPVVSTKPVTTLLHVQKSAKIDKSNWRYKLSSQEGGKGEELLRHFTSRKKKY